MGKIREVRLIVFIIGILVSVTQIVFCADIIVNSYTKAALPPAGTAGRVARVTDNVHGLWMDDGTQWFSINGEVVDVKAFGAKGDGIADDAVAIQSAASAAMATGAEIHFPPGTYNMSSGLTLNRNTRVRISQAAIVKFTATSGSLFTFYSISDSGWQAGGITGGRLLGNAGTTIGVTVGSGSNFAHGLVFERVDIVGFDIGMKFSANGQAFLLNVNNSFIHNNEGEGVLIDTLGAENIRLTNTSIFNNGLSTGRAGISINSGKYADLWIIGGSIDNNGNGTRGQIYIPVDADLDLFLRGVHMEWPDGVEKTPFIESDAGTTHSATLNIQDSSFLAKGTSTTTRPFIAIRRGSLLMSGNRLGSGANTSRIIEIGDVNNEIVRFSVTGNQISAGAAGGNDYQYVKVISTAGVQGRWLNNSTSGSAALQVADFGNAKVAHDQTESLGPTADLILGGKLVIGGGQEIKKHLTGTAAWDPPSIANNASTSTTLTVTGAVLGDNTVTVGFGQAVPGGALLTGAVTSSDTVTVTLFNNTGAALDLILGIVRADVWKH